VEVAEVTESAVEKEKYGWNSLERGDHHQNLQILDHPAFLPSNPLTFKADRGWDPPW